MLDGVHAVGPDSDILATDTEQSLRLTVPWRIQPNLNVAALHLTTSGHLGKCSQAAAAQAPAKPSGLFSSLFVSIHPSAFSLHISDMTQTCRKGQRSWVIIPVSDPRRTIRAGV